MEVWKYRSDHQYFMEVNQIAELCIKLEKEFQERYNNNYLEGETSICIHKWSHRLAMIFHLRAVFLAPWYQNVNHWTYSITTMTYSNGYLDLSSVSIWYCNRPIAAAGLLSVIIQLPLPKPSATPIELLLDFLDNSILTDWSMDWPVRRQRRRPYIYDPDHLG